MLRSISFLVIAAVLAAGCAAPTSDDPDEGEGAPVAIADWAARALPSDEAHDHTDFAQHANLSTPNFVELGWDALATDAYGTGAGGYYCGQVATTDAGQRLAVVNSFTTDVAFVLADVTDPAAPTMLGEYLLDRVHVYDSAITPDGRFVVLGANPETSAPAASALDGLAAPMVTPAWRDACTGETRAAGPEQSLPLAPGVILVDVTDPSTPTFAQFVPTPVLGPHSVYATEVDGTTYVVASITNLEHQASYFQFYEVTDTPLGGQLVHLATYQAPPGPTSTIPLINGHNDASIMKHPVTGQLLAYLANWDGGMVILDISTPQAPIVVSTWGGADNDQVSLGDEDSGGIHGTLPVEGLWDERHYVIAGQELGGHPEGRPTGWIFIVDDTDPANPVEVGRWTLPVDVNWTGFLQFSTHYFSLVERTLFVSMYHGGVWAVDLSTPEAMAAPPTIGAFVPGRAPPTPPATSGYEETLDVLAFENGDLAVFGALSGVYMVRFDPSVASVPPMPAWAG